MDNTQLRLPDVKAQIYTSKFGQFIVGFVNMTFKNS